MTLIFNKLLQVVKVQVHASLGSHTVMRANKWQKPMWPWSIT